MRRLRRLTAADLGASVPVRAVRNYIDHQSANLAGSIAFSIVLSMFPLLLLLSAAAAFVGEPGAAGKLASRILEYAPPAVAGALQPVVDDVLSRRNRALVTIGVFVTLWTASSGTQAIRTALNRAYGVERGRSFWFARFKVMLFTMLGAVGAVTVFSSVVVMPHVWALLDRTVGTGSDTLWLRTSVRYGLAFVALAVLYALFYGWLPDVRQRLRTVLPGALVGAALWLLVAAVLAYVLRSIGRLALVYGGFAGLVATLVFLYLSAVTLILGAEVNGVLMQRLPDRASRRG